MKLYIVTAIKFIIGFFRFGKPVSFRTDKPKAVILLVPIHGNIGDQALGLAGRRFVDDFFPNHEVVEVTMPNLFLEIFALKRHLKKGDLVFVQGGGSMGSRYFIEELSRWVIFSQLKDFTRILFPQSSSFDQKTWKGRWVTSVSKRVYRQYSERLIICIRDAYSLAFMEKHFPGVSFHFFPDIVLYLDEFKSNRKRSGVMYCLREDVESRFSETERKKLMAEIEKRFDQCIPFATTIENTSFTIEQGRKEVENLVGRLGSAELVITDRLHGVILSYISNTPVLAIPTIDHKLTEFFNWISESKRSYLLGENPHLDIERSLAMIDYSEDNRSFKSEFTKLAQLISKQ
ncbi:MAG TPA: polysaccharide pyruvyl transferase family protein [Catalimonadaceae bacterium]|nr:polysaccharide pyruvyl transferase family protein [Catalimonadaceae bacterium]